MLAVVPRPVTVRVPSKVNLHLAVGALRKDGFHELSTVFQSLSLTDEVTVAIADEPGVEVRGEGASTVPTDGANLAWRAVEALARHAGKGAEEPKVRVHIRKNIPVSGGMAGGSADAAATLVGLASLWKLEMARDELAHVAATLGSDVPFMLYGGTALGAGRGEQIVPVLTRHTFHWVLAFARGGLATPKVYGELDRLRDTGEPPRVGEAEPVLEALAAGDPQPARAAAGQRPAGGGRVVTARPAPHVTCGGRRRRAGRHGVRLGPDVRVPVRERRRRGARRRRAVRRGRVPHGARRARPGPRREGDQRRRAAPDPASGARLNVRQALGEKKSGVPPESLESRTPTMSSAKATSTQAPVSASSPLNELFRHLTIAIPA